MSSVESKKGGLVYCNLILRELWVGVGAQEAILHALAATPFHVVWRGVRGAWRDSNKQEIKGKKGKESAILEFREELDIDGILGG